MHFKIILLLALIVMTVSSMPTVEDIPDLQADDQFLYAYGYGYPSYAYAAPLPTTYHVPVAARTDGVPASTAKLVTQPVAYAYPGYPYAGYPYSGGFGYAYGYPITA
ncbi:uncharacterized protein LOC130702540 [Daphnia carinata]|uniref:uncharacterized protein LOC130702540 n=1 Tax=Daphnia carinata TaxID=120202 RepID=UPI00257E5C62|nr:uncharacterized protein LOC130702540 [Daphnia carinata]